jgi:hypothetical protein
MTMSWKAAKKMMDRMDRDALLERLGLEERSPSTDVFGSLGLFAVGILVGAGLGILFAPRRGEEMRSMVGDAIKHRRMDELRHLGAEGAPSPTGSMASSVGSKL